MDECEPLVTGASKESVPLIEASRAVERQIIGRAVQVDPRLITLGFSASGQCSADEIFRGSIFRGFVPRILNVPRINVTRVKCSAGHCSAR